MPFVLGDRRKFISRIGSCHSLKTEIYRLRAAGTWRGWIRGMSPSDTGANPGNCFCNWALTVDEEEQCSSTCVCGQRRTRSGAAGSPRGAERTAAHRPTRGQGAPEAHFFHLWPLLNLNFPLFWGNRELCFVISESPNSVSSIFCSLPPRLSPHSRVGDWSPRRGVR